MTASAGALSLAKAMVAEPMCTPHLLTQARLIITPSPCRNI